MSNAGFTGIKEPTKLNSNKIWFQKRDVESENQISKIKHRVQHDPGFNSKFGLAMIQV